MALIAECLGLDPAGYKRSLAADENSSASCVVLKEQVCLNHSVLTYSVKLGQTLLTDCNHSVLTYSVKFGQTLPTDCNHSVLTYSVKLGQTLLTDCNISRNQMLVRRLENLQFSQFEKS